MFASSFRLVLCLGAVLTVVGCAANPPNTAATGGVGGTTTETTAGTTTTGGDKASGGSASGGDAGGNTMTGGAQTGGTSSGGGGTAGTAAGTGLFVVGLTPEFSERVLGADALAPQRGPVLLRLSAQQLVTLAPGCLSMP